jgi:hypothetical protein
MSLLAKLLRGEPAVENLQIGKEVELRTTAKKRPRKEKGASTSTSKKAKTSKPTKSKTLTAANDKGKECKQPLFTKVERRKIAVEVNKEKLTADVIAKVCSELFEESFPERALLWEYIKSHNQLAKIINCSSSKYIHLYSSNAARARDKNSVLFLQWLDVVRSWTCEEKVTEETRIDAPQFSKATKQTLLAMILNAVYLGLSHQMAETAEQISITTQSAHSSDSSPSASDDVAMHRLFGWALKSTKDNLDVQASKCKKVCHKEQLSLVKDQLRLVHDLKISSAEKHLLPKPVQYLDRGGLTFLKPRMWSWMAAFEVRAIQYLNQKCYRQYGSKLFEV